MKRREFIALTASAFVAPRSAVMAQEPGRVYRLGCLQPFPREVPAVIACFDELRRQGFIEGQNLTINWRDYGLHLDLVSQYAEELAKGDFEVISAGGDVGIRAAQRATKTIPILGITDDMVGSGLVKSMARPDGNTTGVSILSTELDSKRQELLIEAVPRLRHLAVLADSNTTQPTRLHALQESAAARNIEFSIHQITKVEEIVAAIDRAKSSGAAALNVLASPLLFGNRELIIDRVAALQLPAIYQFPEVAEQGGLFGYGPRLAQINREIYARMIVKLFRGAKPAELPIEQPTKFELVINLKAANSLGIAIPMAFLARADKVIE